MFWLGTKSLNTSNQQSIAFGDPNNPNTPTVTCSKQLKGLYYNPMRGERIFPLDSDTLTQLQQANSTYNNLSIVG